MFHQAGVDSLAIHGVPAAPAEELELDVLGRGFAQRLRFSLMLDSSLDRGPSGQERVRPRRVTEARTPAHRGMGPLST